MIVPDYALPAALMIPHADLTIRPLLEEIARLASEEAGVILLSNDPALTGEFVRQQRDGSRFSIVAAPFDTPWIRDRSPIPVEAPGEAACRWIIPRMQESDRKRDQELFGSICAKQALPSPLCLAQGNMVAGPKGVVLSSSDLLRDNQLTDPGQLTPHRDLFGILHWIVFDPFPREQTGHADVHARFLSPRLLATAWNEHDREDRRVIEDLEAKVRAVLPDITILRLPLAAEGDAYASPVNWIQLGRTLLVPRYPLTPPQDSESIRSKLEAFGFSPRFIDSATLEYGGALHCLTASVYV